MRTVAMAGAAANFDRRAKWKYVTRPIPPTMAPSTLSRAMRDEAAA
jgi:hypothetical protein